MHAALTVGHWAGCVVFCAESDEQYAVYEAENPEAPLTNVSLMICPSLQVVLLRTRHDSDCSDFRPKALAPVMTDSEANTDDLEHTK